MKTSRRITNVDDLRAEIQLLKLQRTEQELFFREKINSIKEGFKSPFTFIRKVTGLLKNNKSIHADWATALARISIPFILNKTILRGKGAILKSLLTLLSQKAINPAIFNQSKLIGAVEKISEWVGNLFSKRKKKVVEDYGIPPDSETY